MFLKINDIGKTINAGLFLVKRVFLIKKKENISFSKMG